MKEPFKVTVEADGGRPALRYRFDRRAWQRLQRTLLGKTLVFTDNADWSDVEIVRGYRAQHHVESAFRSMKNTCHPEATVSLDGPEDRSARLLLRPRPVAVQSFGAHRRGSTKSALLDQLGRIREIGVVYPGKKPFVTLSQMTDGQRALYEAIDLKRYLSDLA